MNSLYTETVLSPGVVRRGKFGIVMLFVTLIMAVLMGVLSVNATSGEDDTYNSLRYGVAAGVCAIVVGLTVFSRRQMGRLNFAMLVAWLMYSLLSMASALVNGGEILGELWQGAVVPVFAFIAFPRLVGQHGSKVIAWALILGLGPYLAYSVATVPLYVPYPGHCYAPSFVSSALRASY